MNDISAYLGNWLGNTDEPVPADLIGAEIVAFGAPSDRTLEGGGLSIVYIPKESAKPKRLDFSFTELGMWISGNDEMNEDRPLVHSMPVPWLDWKPISTPPRDGARVLVSDGKEFASAEFANGRFVVSPLSWDGGGESGGLAELDFEPSHWAVAPLPST